MLHACVQRFDVTGNLEKFCKILRTKQAQNWNKTRWMERKTADKKWPAGAGPVSSLLNSDIPHVSFHSFQMGNQKN